MTEDRNQVKEVKTSFSNPSYEQELSQDEINLMDYVRVILKRKVTILICFLAIIITVGIFSFLSPKVYIINTLLEVGQVAGIVVEDPVQVIEKIKGDVYGIFVREKLQITEKEYPEIKSENPKGTRLILFSIESSKTQQSKNILEEINKIILEEHQGEFESKRELLEKEIEFLEKNIDVLEEAIERTRTKIGFLEEEKKNLEAKIEALQKILPYQQDPGTQFALFDTKEKLEQKKQEIEDGYLEINSSEVGINSFKSQINSLQEQITKNIRPTQIVKIPTISEDPVRPRPLFNMALAGILGLFIGTFLAFGREWWAKAK